MANVAYLPIEVDRYGAAVRQIYIRGLDLTGIPMRAQVRLGGDVPGSPLVDLQTVTNGNAEGLRLVDVTFEDTVPVSHVEVVINESTIEALPYAGEMGSATGLAWDWQITLAGRKQRIAKGEFTVTGDGVCGADNAPVSRPMGWSQSLSASAGMRTGATLTFGEERVSITIDGAELVAPLADAAQADRILAESARAGADLAAATALAASRFFPSRAAGEAASAVDQLFSTDDGAGNLLYYRRTAQSSTVIAQAMTTSALSGPSGASFVNFDGRTVRDKLFETVSIADARFAGGAKISATSADNTAAIQTGIDYLAAAGGGTLEVPLGKFNHLPLTQKAGVRIVGKGYGSRLNCTDTSRGNGINAAGPNRNTRITGMSIENIRLTSDFVRGGQAISGNAIRWLWTAGCSIFNVWTESWSDSGISITDSDRVAMTGIFVKACSQGVDVFNDSHGCTLNGLIADDVHPYVPLNIEGLANGSSYRPSGFVGTNIRVTNFGTHGINLVNADYPVVTSWSVSGGVGNAEGPGNGLEAYGCIKPVIGQGIAYSNAGYGVVLGPTQDDTNITGATTFGNGLGGLLVTDGGGVGAAFRISESGCKFLDGVTTIGNVSFSNVVRQQTIRAPLPLLVLQSTSTTNRNAQIIFANSVDANQGRIGWDLTTNNKTNIFQIYQDDYAEQIFGVQVDSITGANDNFQSLGRSDRRFSTVYAGTGAINTSDRRHKRQIGAIPDEWLDAWADVEWCRFKFNDAVEAKGDAARWHIGLIAQQIGEAFASHGLDATGIGLICFDAWAAEEPRAEERDSEGAVIVPASPGRPAGDLWSVRMTECQAMEAAYQRRRIAQLEATVAALTARNG